MAIWNTIRRVAAPTALLTACLLAPQAALAQEEESCPEECLEVSQVSVEIFWERTCLLAEGVPSDCGCGGQLRLNNRCNVPLRTQGGFRFDRCLVSEDASESEGRCEEVPPGGVGIVELPLSDVGTAAGVHEEDLSVQVGTELIAVRATYTLAQREASCAAAPQAPPARGHGAWALAALAGLVAIRRRRESRRGES